MRRKVTYLIGKGWTESGFTVNGVGRGAVGHFRTLMTRIGLEVPEQKYKLTYTLAPKHGKLLCSCFGRVTPFMVTFERREDFPSPRVLNCLVPLEWDQLRFNRKVEVL